QRMSIWRNLVRKHGLGDILTEEKIADLAAKYETSAGGISVVLENAKKMGMTAKNADALIASLMKPHCKLMEVKESGRFLPAKGYSLEGLNIQGKVKLDKIVKAVRNYLDAGFNESSEDKPRMNILMYGAPGTGKTEFVKYLGKTLDRKVLVKKASDLLDMYVGNTEKRIAAAFRQAEAEHAILFFDEIDGLVQDREGASQSWQVTQVNELLQQMENFDGVMIAATNFCKNLDPAIMRRFTFKLSFDYLEDEGKRIFFEKFFGTKLTEGEFKRLREIQNLAPGDFRTVRQERFYLNEPQTNLQLIEALVEECSLKKDGSSVSKIGF
ncbi:MAG: ATP-binding protein, partial [Kiritimatiellae bacterium]|nr:ATP-binding protein [Kiritimatiellia bacterium]